MLVNSVGKIASVIFSVLTYKFNAGDVSFSLWDIILTFLICGLVGLLLYYFIVKIAGGDD